METAPADQPLSDTHYVTLVLRLVLNPEGQLVRGELVEVELGNRRRFANWCDLIGMLRVWISDDRSNTADSAC